MLFFFFFFSFFQFLFVFNLRQDVFHEYFSFSAIFVLLLVVPLKLWDGVFVCFNYTVLAMYCITTISLVKNVMSCFETRDSFLGRIFRGTVHLQAYLLPLLSLFQRSDGFYFK